MSELSNALEEVITRTAHAKLRKHLGGLFANFERALADLCGEYDAEVPMDEFAEPYAAFKQKVFDVASEGARIRATENFIRKVASDNPVMS